MKLVLHPKTRAQLDAIQARPAGSVIFHGAGGLGKFIAATQLAAKLNCTGDQAGPCTNCQTISNGNFPDLVVVERGDKASISIEQIRTLLGMLALRPYNAEATRVVIINDAHLLTLDAQNALLKTLEEPPPQTLVFLITQRLQALLPTVRSRAQTVHFAVPEASVVSAALSSDFNLDQATASELVEVAGGVPKIAFELAASPENSVHDANLTLTAATITEKTMFERLILATELIKAGANLEHFADTIHHATINMIKAGQLSAASASPKLAALEQFRRNANAKVSPRVALERLMLELG